MTHILDTPILKRIKGQKKTSTIPEGKLSQKLAGWKARTLSAADKVVLIHLNLTGMSEYPINWFKFPKYISKEIDKVNRDFFWSNYADNSKYENHKLHTLA